MKFFIVIIFILFSEICLANLDIPSLIGGRVANPGEYPEIIYITSGRSRCSASIVGTNPGVIVTAAHCIEDGGEIEPVAEFVIDQQVYRAKCSHHPDYALKYSFDFALCKTPEKIDVKPAAIAKGPVQAGETAQLTGFGCTKPRKPDGSREPGGNDGLLRVGKAQITRVDDGESGVGGGQYFWTVGDVALCFGDSGAPALLEMNDPMTELHEISGINSRGNIVDRSLLSGTFHSGFRNWALAWAKTNNVEICGINKDCQNPKPDPDDDENECIEERYNVWRYTNLLEEWQSKLEQCQDVDGILLPYWES